MQVLRVNVRQNHFVILVAVIPCKTESLCDFGSYNSMPDRIIL